MRVAFYTLGCKVNQYETEVLSARFAAEGFDVVPGHAPGCDVYVVGSCTVTAEGDRKTRQAVRRFRRENPGAIVVLTGCYPQAFPQEAAAVTEADIVTGALGRAALPQLDSAELFTGMLHNRLGRMMVKYAQLGAAEPVGSLSDGQLRRAADCCKDFRLKVRGTEGFDHAQVTAGGVKTTGFDPETLESWFMPGLFVCGELLDIDGDCGGYNLQWAWASGRLAGRLGK